MNIENFEDNTFKPLPFWREIFLKKESLADYYKNKREYNYNNGTSLKGLKLREKMHSVLLNLLSLNRKYIDKQNFVVLRDESVKTDKAVIYAVTHIGKFDYQIVSEAIKNHQIPFAGDPETMYRSLDGFFLEANGVIYCDTESPTDRKIAKETAIDTLKSGKNLLIYPEGVWNITTNLLTIPLFPGIIEMAQQTDCEIVPVAIEQYGKDFVINIGKNFKVEPEKKENNKQYINDKRIELRDVMANLKWDIIEQSGTIKRSSLGTYEDEKEKFIDQRLNEWVEPKTKEPFYNRELVKSRMFREKGVTAPSDAFAYIKDMNLTRRECSRLLQDLSLPDEVRKYLIEKLREEFIKEEYFEDEPQYHEHKTI